MGIGHGFALSIFFMTSFLRRHFFAYPIIGQKVDFFKSHVVYQLRGAELFMASFKSPSLCLFPMAIAPDSALPVFWYRAIRRQVQFLKSHKHHFFHVSKFTYLINFYFSKGRLFVFVAIILSSNPYNRPINFCLARGKNSPYTLCTIHLMSHWRIFWKFKYDQT